jgi:hypothetical protein
MAPKLNLPLDQYPTILDIISQLDESDKSNPPRNYMQYCEPLMEAAGAETVGEILFVIKDSMPTDSVAQGILKLIQQGNAPEVPKLFVGSMISSAFQKAAHQAEEMLGS